MLRSVVFMAGLVIAAAAFAPDLVSRYLAQRPDRPAPEAMNIPAAPQESYGGRVRIPADRSGHYKADIEVNGRAIGALVDTGASFVVLCYEDARSLGLVYGGDRFDIPVQTANGTGHARRVKLSSVRIGSIFLDDVDAMVAGEGMLSVNLLGMSFLKRLSRYEAQNGMLVLER